MMRILFMGTPDFALFSLRALVESGKELVGVVTQPDKPKGRGYTLTPPPVKVYALEQNIPVYQPTTLRGEEFAALLDTLAPDLIVVAAYGKILPANVLGYPRYGCVNVHGSLLPEYRGAAPMQRAIIDGKRETGITTMMMDVGLDTGDMLIKGEIEIGENETAGELHDRLSALGAEILEKTIDALIKGELAPTQQNHEEFTYAPMLSKELSPVDWNMSASEIHNKIRGLSPWPSANTTLGGKKIKLHKSVLAPEKGSKPGEIIVADKRLVVTCGDLNCIEILELQAEGKKSMSAADFLRGNAVEKGTLME